MSILFGFLWSKQEVSVLFNINNDANRLAVEWVEAYLADPNNKHERQQKLIKRRSSMLKRMQSNISGSSMTAWGRMQSFFGDNNAILQRENIAEIESQKDDNIPGIGTWHNLLVFSAGLSLGLLVAYRK